MKKSIIILLLSLSLLTSCSVVTKVLAMSYYKQSTEKEENTYSNSYAFTVRQDKDFPIIISSCVVNSILSVSRDYDLDVYFTKIDNKENEYEFKIESNSFSLDCEIECSFKRNIFSIELEASDIKFYSNDFNISNILNDICLNIKNNSEYKDINYYRNLQRFENFLDKNLESSFDFDIKKYYTEKQNIIDANMIVL